MFRRLFLSIAVVAVPLAIAGYVVTAPRSVPAASLPAYAADVGNGRIMFEAGGCAACHATPGQSDHGLLGGGLALKTTFGTFYPPNISPDPDAGIGRWSEAEFVTAMQEGTSPAGVHLYPVFPYTSYTRMRLSDVRDLFAYMKTLPTSADASRPQAPAFPFGIRALIGVWKLLYFRPGAFVADPAQSPEWNRGAYLVEGPGHCAECHSPRNLLGAVVADHRFGGGRTLDGRRKVPSVTQANLDIWSVKDIETLLASGEMPDGDTVGSTMMEVVDSTKALPPEDRHAIAVFVKSLLPTKSEIKRD